MQPQDDPQPGDEIAAESVEADVPEAEDLETAYLRALEAIESAENEVGLAFEQLGDEPVEETTTPEVESAPATRQTADVVPFAPPSGDRPSPLAILEAALFVGGTALTSKKLGRLLNDEFGSEAIARFVEQLNERYAEQLRPYEVVFGEGGYRMQLRGEFGDVLHRVFGLGPKEVKLSQAALEVLALVAYRQPVEHATVAEHAGKSGLANVRQLVRRELVEVERDDEEPGVVRYRTTDRFLQVFGLSDLDELPRAVQLELK